MLNRDNLMKNTLIPFPRLVSPISRTKPFASSMNLMRFVRRFDFKPRAELGNRALLS